jgi:hypothetical protein
MHKFKEHWQIKQNWQLIFPLMGILGLVYCSFRLVKIFTKEENFYLTVSVTLVLTYLLMKFCLFIFKKLENKWVVDHRWEIIRIFIVFAVTGSSSLVVSRPIIAFLGITKENLNVFVYWILFVVVGLICYQVLLVVFGWLFGQFQFFWAFEKKMLSRFGLAKLFREE